MILKNYDRFGEKVYIIKMKNGMQVHILPKEEPYYTTYVELSVPYGALDLNYTYDQKLYTSPYGTAHFLEHKVFAMPEGDAFQMFSALGVDANAMTSYNQTSYLFVATDKVMPALSHLMRMLDTPFFTLENIESEKNIIAEELKMYLDDPNVEMQNHLMEMMYHEHPIRYDIGGTLTSIMDINLETLNHIYAHFYQTNNRLITIAGKVDVKVIHAFFKQYDQEHPVKLQKPKTVYPKEPKRLKEKYVVEEKEIGLNKVMLGVKLPVTKLNKRDQIKRELSLSVALNMLLGPSSEMYATLLEKKYINQSFNVSSTFEKHAEYIMIYAETKKVYALKKIMIDFLTQEALNALTQEAYDRYKKVFLGQFIYALNNLETKAYLYGKYYHMGSSLFEVVDMLTEMSYQDVIDSLKLIEKKYIAALIYKKA